MKYLTARQIEALCAKVQRACADGDTPAWRRVNGELHATPVRLYLPVGELLNPAIAGHLWAWQQCGQIGEPRALQKGMPGIAAQGLEAIIPIAGRDLMDVALLALEIGPYRLIVGLEEKHAR